MYGKMVLVSVLAVLVCPCNLMADVATIYPSDDASVDSASGGTNYGSSTSISAGYGVLSVGIRRAYLKFDLSSVPPGRKIISARLRLDAGFVSIPAPQIGAHYLQDDTWTEGTITWNNAPTGFDPSASDTVTVSIDVDYWTVTADVYDAYRSAQQYCVVMKSTNEASATAASFSSQEAIVSDWWPRLEVEHILEYSGGSGTAQYPYLIATAEDLNDIGNHPNDWDAQFRMTADINLAAYTGTEFNIIGDYVGYQDPNNKPFTGVFDGNGHTIYKFNYNCTDAVYFIGLFSYVDDPNVEIKNLGLVDPNVQGVNVLFGVGSLVARLEKGSVAGCWAEGGKVKGDDYIGGLIGGNSEATIINCYANTTVEGDWRVGGLVGNNHQGSISKSYSTGTVNGADAAGGLVGYNGRGSISESCSTTNVEGDVCVGGLVGNNSSSQTSVSDSYSMGRVVGNRFVGGLVGRSLGNISNSYSTGSVEGNTNIGGLLGYNLEGTVTNSFWDVNTSGLYGSDGGTPKTTAEMQTQSTFTDAGWDFVGETANGTEDIWRMCVDGVSYPLLSWEFTAGDLLCPDGVDLVDYSHLANRWQELNCAAMNDCDRADLDFSGVIDWHDLKIFCHHWLEGTSP